MNADAAADAMNSPSSPDSPVCQFDGSTAFNLTEQSRQHILSCFPPRYDVIKCHHITYEHGVDGSSPLPPAPQSVVVVGYASDDDGVEALVVEVDGTTVRPVDGGVYHITLSVAEGRKARESNDIIERLGWSVVTPLPVTVVPAFND